MPFSLSVLRSRTLPIVVALATLWILPPLAARVSTLSHRFPQCALHVWTGWDCPLCGLVRGTLLVSQGQLAVGASLHPGSTLVWLMVASLSIVAGFDLVRPRGRTRWWARWLAERAGWGLVVLVTLGLARYWI